MDLIWQVVRQNNIDAIEKSKKQLWNCSSNIPKLHTALDKQPDVLGKDIILFPHQLKSVGWMKEVENKIARRGKHFTMKINTFRYFI